MPKFVRDYWVDWQAGKQQREDEAKAIAGQMVESSLHEHTWVYGPDTWWPAKGFGGRNLGPTFRECHCGVQHYWSFIMEDWLPEGGEEH